MPMIIDPPSPFASIDDWREFLSEMEDLAKAHPDNDEIAYYIEEARAIIDA